ncbi:MAG TPA: hypothetical protein ENN43_06195 [bacterium]|nr:hypothetical protein [bacterium]
MEFTLYVKSFMLGFAIAAPVGVVGMLALNRILTDGLKRGILTGIGAASADGLYAAIAAAIFAVSAFFPPESALWLRLAGGAGLIVFGAFSLLKRPETGYSTAAEKICENRNDFSSAFFLRLANLPVIAVYVCALAGFEALSRLSIISAAGLFSGSLFWWIFMSLFFSSVMGKFLRFHVVMINFLSTFIVIGFGVAFVISAAAGM